MFGLLRRVMIVPSDLSGDEFFRRGACDFPENLDTGMWPRGHRPKFAEYEILFLRFQYAL